MQTENAYVETDLGNIALNPRGEYSDETSYEYLDTVSYKGGSYVCLAELTKTISGIAPAQGKNTDMWQMLTLPGQLTPEAVAMHDDVVNKAKQVETSRAAVELSQQEVEAAQADVTQMRQDTQEASEEAIASRDSAAGYAQSAEVSRTAAKESEDNINAQVTGFDTHVAEKTSAAETAITEARRAAVSAVSTKQDNVTQAVTDEGDKQMKNVEDAGTEQVGKVKSAGGSAVSAAGAAGVSAVNAVKAQQTASIKAVADKGTQQVTAVNTAGSTQVSTIETKGADQVKAIKEAGENAFQNISNGVDKGLSEEGKAADAKATGEAISKLTEDIFNKITKFYASNQGETHLADSDNGKIMDMMVYGKSEQKYYSGKNLLSPVLKSQTIDGIACVDNGNGTYTFTGTATNTVNFKVYGSGTELGEVSKEFTNKKLVGCPSGGGTDKYFLRTSDNITYSYTDFGQGTKITTDIRYIYIRFIKGVTVSGLIFKPMVTDDLDATYDDFEPYTGGHPSPSPDYPQEIKSVVNPTVKVSSEDETESQTVTLPYTLNAIPVSSDGNVTINGQQYIADYVNVERGKYVQMIQTDKVRSNIAWNIQRQQKGYSLGYTTLYKDGIPTSDSGMEKAWKSNIGDSSGAWSNVFSFGRSGVFWIVPYENDGNITSNDINAWLVEHPMNIMYPLAEPIETDLTPEEIEAFKALVTNYPVTDISVTSDHLDGYTVFNYPISMANGWNYVKQQLNDNRDYIYDMDLQSAEAYVNSEYAVALTELEV